MFAVWKDAYRTGHHLVDDQHQELFRLINEFARAIAAGRGRALVTPVLDRILDYVEVHFEAEEALMRRTGFPALAQHRAIHRAFRAETSSLAAAYRAGRLVLPITLSQFLVGWLKGHIEVEDRALVDWLRAAPRGAAAAGLAAPDDGGGLGEESPPAGGGPGPGAGGPGAGRGRLDGLRPRRSGLRPSSG